MKKILFAVLPMLLAVGCAPEPGAQLPPTPDDSYTAVLNTVSSTLTHEDSVENITVNLASSKSSEVTYSVMIGAPCYIHNTYDEILIKGDGFFKSVSSYHVDRLIIDCYGGQVGIIDVYSNVEGTGTPVAYHESSVAPADPDGGGKVFEYPIDSTGWLVKRTSGLADKQKPGIYSVTIVFEIE